MAPSKLFFSLASSCIAITAWAQSSPQQTVVPSLAPGAIQTEQLEQKIIKDLTQMIHEYDFSSAFNEAVTEEQARQIKWQAEYKPSV